MASVVRLEADQRPTLSYRPPEMVEIRWWQKNVQPVAEQLYVDSCRGWNWPWLIGLCVNTPVKTGHWRLLDYLSRLVSLGTRSARYDWQSVALFHNSKPMEPLAVAIYLLDTTGLRPSDPRTLYLEFFMAQPSNIHGYQKSPKFGQYLMDMLIIQSREAGLDGRVTLHAASEGLRKVYEAWGFTGIHANDPLIRFRRNNGLFYELLPSAALAFNQRFDHLR